MRPITKILLLVVVAFFVYLLWPRTADLKSFVPEDLARLEVESWRAQKLDRGFDAFKARFEIYASQYHFAPVAAFRIAQSQGAAMDFLKQAHGEGPDSPKENRALSALAEKYTWIKKQTQEDLDAEALAREELAWRMLELDGAQPGEVAVPMANILAVLYGGGPEDFAEVALNLATARASIFQGTAAESGESDPTALATDAYALLREIAATPPAPASGDSQ